LFSTCWDSSGCCRRPAEPGTIEVGKRADLVLLDADPTVDIRNTRRIWQVVKYGQLVDRPAILKVMRPK